MVRVLISGATGLIGTELAKQLKELGHTPVRLVRRAPKNTDEIFIDASQGKLDFSVMDTIDAVVNLAGATTGKIPWTKKYMKEIVDSRLETTRLLVEAINSSNNPPKVLVSGSASGIYGDRGDELLDEDSGKGEGFLSDLAFAWEEEAKKAKTRVVLIRTTMVMSKKLGALGKLLPLIKLGVGGPLGSGKQWWAWISLEDQARAIIHLIENKQATGAYNITAPEPATCEQIVRALGKALHRPTLFRVPAWLMNLVIGVAAKELLLCSQKMSAEKLISSGYKFNHPTLRGVVEYVVS
ncbi:MAG: TIGR01777 family protein [Actinobacteria bacterium]|nr:TIGR01777 family protein [Actinomycetota bacterium]